MRMRAGTGGSRWRGGGRAGILPPMTQWHTGAKRVETLAFSPDGATLASATYQGEVIKLWRPDGTPLGRVSVSWAVRAVAFSPDGRTLAVGHDLGVTLFDPADREPPTPLVVNGYGRAVAVRPDGSAVAAAVSGKVLWWDLPVAGDPDGRELPAERPDRNSVSGLAFTPDGRRLVANAADAVLVWDAEPTGPPRRRPHPNAGFVRTHVAVSAAGRVAASHGRDISVWPADEDGPPVRLAGPRRCPSVRGMGFTPDGGLLVVAADGVARRWDVDAGAEREAWDFGVKNIQGLAVSPDGLTAAVGTQDGRIVVRDV